MDDIKDLFLSHKLLIDVGSSFFDARSHGRRSSEKGGNGQDRENINENDGKSQFIFYSFNIGIIDLN